jgi:hypothetical protein
VPTGGIAELFFRYIGRLDPAAIWRISQQVDWWPWSRSDHYHEFDIEVAVDSDLSWKAGPSAKTGIGLWRP